jgi:hypothetical protein
MQLSLPQTGQRERESEKEGERERKTEREREKEGGRDVEFGGCFIFIFKTNDGYLGTF